MSSFLSEFKAQRYHLGRIKSFKEQISTLQQSIEVVRQRNRNLTNLFNSSHSSSNDLPTHQMQPSLSEETLQTDMRSVVAVGLESSSLPQYENISEVSGQDINTQSKSKHDALTKIESFSEDKNVNVGSKPSDYNTDCIVDVDIESLICPITQEEFEDPVVAADGHTYERGGILQWLEKHDTSPLTGAQLSSKKLFKNWTLRSVMSDYKKKMLDHQNTAMQRHKQTEKKVEATSSSVKIPVTTSGESVWSKTAKEHLTKASKKTRDDRMQLDSALDGRDYPLDVEMSASQTCCVS